MIWRRPRLHSLPLRGRVRVGAASLAAAVFRGVFLGNIYRPRRLGMLTGAISMIHQIADGLDAYADGW